MNRKSIRNMAILCTCILAAMAQTSTAKTTGTKSRLLAAVNFYYRGTYLMGDSTRYFYTGERGGDLNSARILYDKQEQYAYYEPGRLEIAQRNIQSFDAANNVIHYKEQWWDEPKKYVTDFRQTFSTYNVDNQVETELFQQMNDTWGTWVDHNKYTSEYNSSKEISVYTIETKKASSPENDIRYLYSYAAPKKTSTIIQQNWNALKASWDTTYNTERAYDVSGNLISELKQVRTLGGGYDNYMLQTNTYDTKGNILTSSYQEWDKATSAWKSYRYEVNKYDAANNKTEFMLSATWMKGPLDTVERHFYTYNTYNQCLTDSTNNWDKTTHSWVLNNSSRKTKYYYEEYSSSSIQEANATVAVKIYPVPAGDQLNLDIKPEKAQKLTITLTDLQGRTVLSSTTAAVATLSHKLALGNISSGNYILKISGDSGAQFAQQITVAH